MKRTTPFYADGRNVFKAPVERKRDDGSTAITMGFRVCVCDEFIDGVAAEIAIALNRNAVAGKLLDAIKYCLEAEEYRRKVIRDEENPAILFLDTRIAMLRAVILEAEGFAS